MDQSLIEGNVKEMSALFFTVVNGFEWIFKNSLVDNLSKPNLGFFEQSLDSANIREIFCTAYSSTTFPARHCLPCTP